MYRVRRPTNNCLRIAHKCTKSHTEFKTFSGGDTPGRPSAGGSAPDPRPGLGNWKGGNPSNMSPLQNDAWWLLPRLLLLLMTRTLTSRSTLAPLTERHTPHHLVNVLAASCRHQHPPLTTVIGNASVPKTRINNTINLLFKLQSAIR